VSPDGGPLVTVVAPVWRNAGTLEALCARTLAALSSAGARAQLVFVCDASPDDSAAELRDLAARDPRLEPVLLERRVGQHHAVIEGLRRARGETVVVLDADLQDPPEAIPRLLARLREGYGAVFAGRRGRYESLGRLATSRIFKRLLAAACGVPPDAGMYVAMTRAVADRIAATREARPFVVAMIGCTGVPTTSVPVRRDRSPGDRSGYGGLARLRTGVSALVRVAVWRRRLRVTHV
jgi:glycosyltransferase involved in cell wall biosynthesis